MNQESGLWKRGMLLFALVAALAAVVLFTLLHRPEPDVPMEQLRAETLAPMVATPGAVFPGTFCWGALFQLGETLASPKGWEIRYQATLALARRGSAHVRLDVLREMLDEQRQMRNFRTALQDGHEVPDEAAARQTVLGALKGVVEWHKHAEAVSAVGLDNADLQRVYAAIDRLAQSANRVVAAEAEKARIALKRA